MPPPPSPHTLALPRPHAAYSPRTGTTRGSRAPKASTTATPDHQCSPAKSPHARPLILQTCAACEVMTMPTPPTPPAHALAPTPAHHHQSHLAAQPTIALPHQPETQYHVQNLSSKRSADALDPRAPDRAPPLSPRTMPHLPALTHRTHTTAAPQAASRASRSHGTPPPSSTAPSPSAADTHTAPPADSYTTPCTHARYHSTSPPRPPLRPPSPPPSSLASSRCRSTPHTHAPATHCSRA